jgi:hypothetical protein
MDRYDVLTVREANGKSYFTKLGAMFPNRNGDGFTVMLDAIPAATDGQYKLIVKRPQERDQQRLQPRQQGNGRGYNPADDDMGDAPF